MRPVFLGCLLLLLPAASATAQVQVQVDVRLEKTRYLAGEPIVIVVDVTNVGDKAVGYSVCEGAVRLDVTGAERRVPPHISGCFSGMGSAVGGVGCAGDPPPMLTVGQTTSARYLLKEYTLRPGHYQLTASGKVGVAGVQVNRTLTLDIAEATKDELQRSLAPLVLQADGADAVRRRQARDALIESAPPFLEALIARFAAEEQHNRSAIEALGRIGTTGSRTHLKNFFRMADEARRFTIVQALIGVRQSGDAAFLGSVLQDETVDPTTRRYAALGLGYIGGDEAVPYLEAAFPAASLEIRSSIATALGNTRSRAAVPVLIGMFGNNPSREHVCGALRTLTHQTWCDGTADDPVAKRRHWLRRWNQTRSTAAMFGTDDCPADPVVPSGPPRVAAVEPAAASGLPKISSLRPAVAAPNSIMDVSGYALGLEDSSSVRVLFTQGHVSHIARISSSGRVLSRDPDGAIQYMDVVVPPELAPGQWQLVIDANGRRSEAMAVEITTVPDVELIGISPPRPHPAQGVLLDTKAPAQIDDRVQLTDARGRQWRIATGISSYGISLTLPDEVADGATSLQVVRRENGGDRLSAPLVFFVTSEPLALNPSAVGLMTPVAPGQWTDLAKDGESEFEIRRSDRIEVEFRQGNVAVISEARGPDSVHIQVPVRLRPGAVSVRNRTWIEQTASAWSAPTAFRILERPVPPSITMIEAGPVRDLVWWPGDAAPTFIQAHPGEALVLRGHFPVARTADLRIQLRGTRETVELPATDVDAGVRVHIPARAAFGDWRLLIGTRDGRIRPREITTVRVR